MCGIAAYVGERPVVPIILDSLKRLEYRGYDSAGISLVGGPEVQIVKAAGPIAALEKALAGVSQNGGAAAAHTRWATHGAPSERNAHPHADCSGKISVVHNGIIENYIELKRELEAAGHRFESDTDTEVIAHLIEENLHAPNTAGNGHAGGNGHSTLTDPQRDLEAAVRATIGRLEGSYALVVTSAYTPGTLYIARKHSPLVVGLGQGENFVASDIPAVLPYTREVVIMEDDQFGVIRGDHVAISDVSGGALETKVTAIDWDADAAEKGGYDHFMLKEIHEQPDAIRNTLTGRLKDGHADLEELELTAEQLAGVDRVYIVACGTAYHAGLVGGRLLERRLGVPVTVEIASEFRYREPAVTPTTLGIFISQSGETADTLAALHLCQAAGARTVAVVNVVGSTLSRDADHVLYTRAGPEICVASTKAYTTQITAMVLLALYLSQLKGTADAADAQMLHEMVHLPELIEETMRLEPEIIRIAALLRGHPSFFFIGRGLDYAVALEGALKLKEITYRFAEAYAAGEMKHGPLALLAEGVPVIALATQEELFPKMLSNMKEAKARGAVCIGLCRRGMEARGDAFDWTLPLPSANDQLMPILTAIPLQLFAYHVARLLEREIDQPRNLAKSVTVE